MTAATAELCGHHFVSRRKCYRGNNDHYCDRDAGHHPDLPCTCRCGATTTTRERTDR